jgi:ABC-type branched-subunit amino acid transport system substrate-binding protein
MSLLALTACGSGGNSANGSDSNNTAAAASGTLLSPDEAGKTLVAALGALPQQQGNTTRGIHGKVITIGGVGTDTRSGQHTLPGLSDGAKARFARANREGGVNGYTFNYVGFTDDAGQPDKAQQGVQNLVEGKQVFAVVPYASGAGAVGDYLNKNKVPYFGWLSQDYCGWADKPYAFSVLGQSSCAQVVPGKIVGSTSGLEAYLKASGKKPSDIKLALYGSSDAFTKPAMAATAAGAAALGIRVVYNVADLPSTTEPPLTDFTPIATRIIQSGANVVIANTSPPATLGVTGALKSNGFQGDYVLTFAAEALLQNPATAQTVDGAYGTIGTGSIAFGADKVQQVTDDLRAIGSQAPVDGLGTVTTYWAADLFIQALKQVKGDLTAEKLADVLNLGGFTDQAIPGLTCAQVWPTGKALSASCGAAIMYDARSKKLQPKVELAPLGKYIIADSK